MKSMFRGRWATALAVVVATIQSHAAACIGLSENAAGWWQGDSLQDAITRGGGTFRGTAAVGGGFAGSGFNFDGGTDALQLPADFMLRSQDFAVEAWIKRSSESISSRDVEAGEFFANSNDGLAFGLTHDGRLYLSHIGVVSFFGTTAIRDTNWNHVAVTREGGVLRFYTNGVPATAISCPVVFNLDGPYAIGGLGAAYGGAFYGFLGSIDEIAAYNRALSASEIAAIHQAGAAGKCPTGPGNLIVNGSFETPAYSAAHGMLPNTAFVRTRNLPGWEVAPGDGAVEIELKDFSGATAAAGGQSLELEGAEGLPAYFVRQDVNTAPGRTYRLKFAYAKNPLQSLSRLRVELAGASVSARDFEHGLANSRAVPVWQQGMVEFVATAATVRVQFTGTSPNPGYGMLLDDVSLQEVRFRSLEVENPGFEQLTGSGAPHFTTDGRLADGHYSSFPGFPIDGSGFFSPDPIPGWAGPAPGGTFNPSSAALPGGAPEGQNLAWINGAGAIRQRLSETFEAERIYRLSVDVASLAGVAFPGYALALYGNDVAAVQSENPQPVPAGGHVTANVEFKLAKDSPLVGAPIEIRLATLGGNGQGDFDNVRLQVESSTPDAGCANAPTGLVAWYRGEDSTSDHHGQHPTTFAAPRYAAGKVGRAFDFDGSNEVMIPDAADLNFTAFSAEAWVYPTSLDGDVEIIMNKEVNGFDTIAFELGVKGPTSQAANTIPTGNLAVFVGGVSGMPSDYSGWSDAGVAVPLNTWSHVVLTYGDGMANAFVNGVLSRQFTNLTGALRTTTGPLKIGSRSDSVVANFPSSRFNGRIDEASLYSRALNAGEVGALFNAGNAGKCIGLTCTTPPANLASWLRGEGDSSDWTFAHPGTFAASKFALGKVGQAFEFDGSNEVVLGDAADFNQDTFTLEAWIYPTSLDGAVDMIANKEAGTDFSQFQFEIGLKGPINEVTSQIPLGNVSFYLAGVTGLPDEYGGWVDGKGGAPLNQWTHVALAVEPGAVTVFVNGVATRRLTGLGGTLQRTTGPLKLGSRHDNFAVPRPAERFNGRIDEFSFYTRRLADAEIAAIHAAGEMGKCFRDAPPGDLELVLKVPAKVGLDQDFVVTAKLINHGIAPATQVTLTNTVPLGVSVGAVTNSQGSSVNLAGFVISTLGTIGGGQTATVQVTCRPLLGGSYTVSGALGRAEIDPVPANDRQELNLEALPLELSFGADFSAPESASSPIEIPVLLSATTGYEITVEFMTIEGSARAGRDFIAANGRLVFPPGSTQASISLPLVNDGYFETDETLSLVLTNVVGAPLGRSNLVITLQSDDRAPQLAVGDAVVREGQGGFTNAVVEVRLTGASEEPVTVKFATANNTALTPTDYVSTNGILTFAPGVIAQNIHVRINGDTAIESNEAFLLELSEPIHAELADARGAVVVLNDDAAAGQVASFAWDPVPSPQEIGKPFPVGLTALDANGSPLNGFNAVVQLAAVPGPKRPVSVLISELDFARDMAEFTNVGTNAVDLTGWTATFYDATTWPLPRGTVALPDGAMLPPRGVFTITESPGSQAFPNLPAGFPLVWDEVPADQRPDPAMVLLRDAAGEIVDCFAAGAAFPSQVNVPVSIPASEWQGLPVTQFQSFGLLLQRGGQTDTDSAADWTFRTATRGRTNVGLSLPFRDAQPLAGAPAVAMEFSSGRWNGHFQVDGFSPLVSLMADDGNGAIGFSAAFALTATNDLAVSLVASAERAVFPGYVEYVATVTNLGPEISTNVVLEVRVAPYYGSSALGFLSLIQISQGLIERGLYATNLPGSFVTQAIRLTGKFGDIPPMGKATLSFWAARPSGPQILVPVEAVTIASVSRQQPEANWANNTAQVLVEISWPCPTLVESALGWWRGEGDSRNALSTNLPPETPESPAFGPGRVGTSAFAFAQPGLGIPVSIAPSVILPEGEDFTVEGWVKVTGGVERNRIALLGNRADPLGPGLSLFIAQGRLGIVTADSRGAIHEGATDLPLLGKPDLRDGRWHHFAVLGQRGANPSLVLLVDGTAKSLSQGFAVTGAMTGTGELRLGGDASLGTEAGLVGQLDEVTLYRSALTVAQVQEIFRAGAAGKCVADFRVTVESPESEGATFKSPIAYGRPTSVSVTLTNAGPLDLTSSWLWTGLPIELGATRILTPVVATGQPGNWIPEHDFGPLKAYTSRLIQLEVTLTNLPPNTSAEFHSLPRNLGIQHRYSGVFRFWPINPDGDADQADDRWELANGFDPLNAADATADTDGDGFRNVDEFQLGTDPRNATDVLKLELSAADANGVRFRFPGKGGKSYGLFRRAQLGDPWSEVSRFTTTENAMVELADATPPAEAAFYQIQLLPNP